MTAIRKVTALSNKLMRQLWLVGVDVSTSSIHSEVREDDLLKSEHWELWNLWMQAHRVLTQDVERRLQIDFGISKADFSVLATLSMASAPEVKVQELVQSLGWEKSRVAHQLSRMESRGLLVRVESTKGGRRVGIGLTSEGRRLAKAAIRAHGDTVRRLFFDTLSVEQAEVIREWSTQVIGATRP